MPTWENRCSVCGRFSMTDYDAAGIFAGYHCWNCDIRFGMNGGNGFKPIPGYEGFYSASKGGQIRRDPGSPYCKTGRILKPKLHHSAATDYHRVRLCVGGDQKNFFVHRLIMLTFKGPCPDGKVVCHGKEGSLVNRLDNLEYDTQKENIRQNIWMATQEKEKAWNDAQPGTAEAVS